MVQRRYWTPPAERELVAGRCARWPKRFDGPGMHRSPAARFYSRPVVAELGLGFVKRRRVAMRHHAGNPDHLNDGPEPGQLRRRAGRGIFVDAPDRPAILIEGPVLAIGLRRRCEAGWAMSRGANR